MSKTTQHRDRTIKTCQAIKRTMKVVIIKCGNNKYWYKNMIGEELTIDVYGTYGAWDTDGRWVDFWDVRPVE